MKKLIHIFVIALFLWPITDVYSAFLYKNYIVRQDQGKDILCDPYVVRKNDWVIKIFQRRGQIADQDFPEFLEIFSRLNPSIENVNKIIPGQHILIPLKKLTKGSLPGQSSGFVTIPFVTVSKIPDLVKENSSSYKVRPGDNVSSIISKTYDKKSQLTYSETIQLFKLINPNVENIDLIYPGQVLNVPNRTLGNKALYDTLFNDPEKMLNDSEMASHQSQPVKEKSRNASQTDFENSSFATVASILDATLIYEGKHVFPREGQKDLIIDLSKYPLMELQNGKKILFSEENDMTTEDQAYIEKQWKGIRFVTLPRESKFDKIMDSVLNFASDSESYQNLVFDDDGVKVGIYGKWMVPSGSAKTNKDQGQKTIQPYTFITITYPNDERVPDTIKRYLAKYNIGIKEISPKGKPLYKNMLPQSSGWASSLDKNIIDTQYLKSFVKSLVDALDFQYTENTNISFPYAGVQVKAVSNLISTPSGSQVLADYGDLYGDAASAIESTGLSVIQLNEKMSPSTIIEKIFQKSSQKFSRRLEITPVNRQDSLEISFEIPGFVYDNNQRGAYLITSSRLEEHLVAYLNQKDYKVILFSEAKLSIKTFDSETDGRVLD